MKAIFDSLGRSRLGLSELDVRQRLYSTPRWRRLLVMAGACGTKIKMGDESK